MIMMKNKCHFSPPLCESDAEFSHLVLLHKHPTNYGDGHCKWQDGRGAILGANETREFIIGSLGATRRRGVETGMTQEWHQL